MQSELDDLEYELYALKTEMTECHTDVGRSHHLQMEPTVFKEHSLNNLRPVSRCLPPKAPSPRMSKTALKSCLKSSNDNQSFFAHPPETPRAQSKETRDRISSVTLTSTLGSATNSSCDTPSPFMPPTPPSRPISMAMQSTNSKIIDSRKHCQIRNVEMADDPFQVEAKNTVTGLSIQHFSPSRPTGIENADLKERVSSPQRTSPQFPEPNAVTPSWTDQLQHKRFDTFSCSGRDYVGPETTSNFFSENGTVDSKSVTPTLPPRYASPSPSWQEDGNLQTPSWEECQECISPTLLTASDKSQDKTETSVKDILITSLDSEAATTRLIAEVIAVQSRLEDCKLKPLDFREFLTEPVHPSRTHSRFEYHPKNDETSCMDSCEMTSQHGQAYEPFKRGQALPEVNNYEDHATDVLITFDDDSLRDLNLDTNFMAERNTAASPRSTGDYAESVAIREQRTGQSGKTDAQGVSQEETIARIEEFSQEVTKKSEGGICRSTNQSNPKLDAEWSGTKSNKHSSPFLQPPSPAPISSLSSALPDTCAGSHIEICRPLSTTHDETIPQTKSVLLQTDFGMDHDKEIPHLAQQEISETLEDPQFESSVDQQNISDRSLMSTERTSKYLNLGYRDLTETPRSRIPKLHCFYSSQGLIETGYSQPRNSPAAPHSEKKTVPQDNRHHRIYAYNDSSGDKENYGICGPDDQELSILASLERLDWKLAAISARAMSRTHPTPSVVSQGQGSTKSAPAVVGENVVPSEGRPTPRKPPTNPLRPSVSHSSMFVKPSSPNSRYLPR